MDMHSSNPGPIDDSVLYDQDKHVSAAVWEGQVTLYMNSCPSLISSFVEIYLQILILISNRNEVHLGAMNIPQSWIAGFLLISKLNW